MPIQVRGSRQIVGDMAQPGNHQQVAEVEGVATETRLCGVENASLVRCQTGDVYEPPQDVPEFAMFTLHARRKYQLNEIEHRKVHSGTVLPIDNASDRPAVGRHPKVSRTKVTMYSTDRHPLAQQC